MDFREGAARGLYAACLLVCVQGVSGLAGCSPAGDGRASSGGVGGSSSTSGPPSSGGQLGLGGLLGSGNESGGGGLPMGCNDLTIETKEVTPTVLLLVDNSSSMFEPREQLWDPLYQVLMSPADGLVKSLESKIRFGFTSYRGEKAAGDPACPNLFEVEYALNNHAAIDAKYAGQGQEWAPGVKWETPTGAALRKASEKLQALSADPPGPKFIILVTDGNPNTCGVVDPQCGSDDSIAAAQEAHRAGIGTFAIGIGDIVTTNSGCEATWGRCGALHLQDLANAGQGQPVAAPPDALRYQQCTPTQTLAATYADPSAPAGTAKYYTASSSADLRSALSGLLNSVVSCTYDMNAVVVGDPELGTVSVNGQIIQFGDANGWKLEANNYRVTLLGEACESFKAQPGGTLAVSFPCKVAKPR